jgi:hypothetical protein
VKWPLIRRPPAASDDAEQAQAEARRALADARNFDRRVDRVAGVTRQIGLRNHFAEAVELAIIPRGVK